MIIRVADAVIGEVLRLESHPNAQRIWLAHVRMHRHAAPVRIVFGGTFKLRRGDLVAVAPPGVRITRRGLGKPMRMRSRNYRGVRSQGMLCSLNELGWTIGGPDEVAVFRDLIPGFPLDEVPVENRPKVVKRWDRVIEEVETGKLDPLLIPTFPNAPTTLDRDRPTMARPVPVGV